MPQGKMVRRVLFSQPLNVLSGEITKDALKRQPHVTKRDVTPLTDEDEARISVLYESLSDEEGRLAAKYLFGTHLFGTSGPGGVTYFPPLPKDLPPHVREYVELLRRRAESGR